MTDRPSAPSPSSSRAEGSLRWVPSRSLAPPPEPPPSTPRDQQADPEQDWYRLLAVTLGLVLLLVVAGIANAAADAPARGGEPLGLSAASLAVAAARLVDSSGAGRLLLRDAQAEAVALAPWLDGQLDVQINGIVAHVTLRQGFMNVSDAWVAGEYSFPLPGDAAVRRLVLRLGDREIIGRVAPRQEARRSYEDARAQGQRAALLEQSRSDLFAVHVANIPPRQRVEVVLEYTQVLRADGSDLVFQFPMTVTPRYSQDMGAAEVPEAMNDVDVRHPHPPVLSESEDYRALLGVTLQMDGGIDGRHLASPSHELAITPQGDGHRVTLAGGKVPMDRDLVLRLRPLAGIDAPRAGLYRETIEGETYVLAVVTPPAAIPAHRRPREVVIVVDTSGSMQGESIRQAKRAALAALEGLTPQDRLNVIAFADETRALFPFPVPADHHAVRRARELVRGLRAEGGTYMHRALSCALDMRPADEHLRQVVFVTDGAVTEGDALAALVRQLRGEARLYPVGIGPAPAGHLMEQLAEAGRGSYTRIADLDEVEQRMATLFDRLAHPVLTDIAVDWPAGTEFWPSQVPDLHANESLVLAARLPGVGGPATLRATGRLAGSGTPWERELRVEEAAEGTGVGLIFANAKVAALTRGEGAGGVKLAPEARREAITAVGMRHGLLTQYTSFVAVERHPARSLMASLEDTTVPALLPAGGARIGYPGTATGAPAQAMVAGWLMLFAGLILALRRAVAQAPPAAPAPAAAAGGSARGPCV